MADPFEALRDPKARLYKMLERLDDATLGEMGALLNAQGYPSLTVCPNCRVDDFFHTQGCEYDFEIGLNIFGELEAVNSEEELIKSSTSTD